MVAAFVPLARGSIGTLEAVDKETKSLAPGSNWRAWSYNGRTIWLDPDEFESREVGPDGAWRVSTPACVVARDGELLDAAAQAAKPGA
jgi:hypothetical protein